MKAGKMSVSDIVFNQELERGILWVSWGQS